DPLRAHGRGRRDREARNGRGLTDVGARDVTLAADLGGQQPHGSPLVHILLRINERIGQISVVRAPPQHDAVDDLSDVAIDHGVPGMGLDRRAKFLVDVLIPAELLDDGVRYEAQLSRVHRTSLCLLLSRSFWLLAGLTLANSGWF